MDEEMVSEAPETEEETARGEPPGAVTDEEGDRDGVTKPAIGEPVVADGPLDKVTTWFYLVGHRLLVAGLLLIVGLVLFTAVDSVLGPVEPARPGALFYLFAGLIGGNFTLITIVISINQLVVSQQIGPPGELRQQIESTNEYRGAVEESVDVPVAPVTPTEFLDLLLRSTADAVEEIRAGVDDVPGGEPIEQLHEVCDGIYRHVGHVQSLLTDDRVSVFQALAAALDTNYSEEMYRLRELRSVHGQSYSEEIVECLDDLVVRLQQIDVARQYLKTIYIQDELSRLSRNLLYVGVPAVLVSAFVLRVFAAPDSAVISPEEAHPYLPLAFTITLAPLTVLFAYVVRLSTVAQRTIAITPFTTAAQERI